MLSAELSKFHNADKNELNLSRKKLTSEDIPAVVAFLRLNPLIAKLNLSCNPIDDQVAITLASVETLTHLNLDFCRITDQGAITLARKKHLIALNLSRNSISDAAMPAFAGNQTLRWLDLSMNAIGDKGAELLAINRGLNFVNLTLNSIGDTGGLALANNDIIEFRCANNHMSPKMKALHQALDSVRDPLKRFMIKKEFMQESTPPVHFPTLASISMFSVRSKLQSDPSFLARGNQAIPPCLAVVKIPLSTPGWY